MANYAGEVTGAQIGIVNIGGRVRGLRLGSVNVADEVDVVSLGLINVVWNGGVAKLGCDALLSAAGRPQPKGCHRGPRCRQSAASSRQRERASWSILFHPAT